MMARLLAILVVLSALFGASLAEAQTEGVQFGRYHALVVGNTEYRYLDKLKTAVFDADAVADLLEAQYGFNVTRLTNATRDAVLRALTSYRRELKPNDNLLIYYAGHGVLDSITQEGYWLPVDAERDVPTNWISVASITTMLKAIRAKHVMVVSDSCYSGTLVRAARAELKTAEETTAWLKRMTQRRSRTAMASGGLEPVLDGGGGKHSVFAKAFIGALRENDEVLDGQSLFDRVKRPVVLNANQTPRYADIRNSGHDGGDFLFVKTRGITVTPKAPAQTASPPASTGPSNAAEILFWQSIQDSDSPPMFSAYLDQYPRGTFAQLARLKIEQLKQASPNSTQATAARPKDRLGGSVSSECLDDAA